MAKVLFLLFLCLYHCDERKNWIYEHLWICPISSRKQNENQQLIALKEVGLTGKVIFLDKQSGKGFNRPHAKVNIVVLDMPLLDTRRGKDLLGPS